MKNTAIILSLLSGTAAAQSPYLSVTARMDTSLVKEKHFKIEMKICKPIQTSARNDWFSPDTSSIDFNRLRAADLRCSPFSGNGEGVEVLSGNISFQEYNEYTFSNQVFAWENILVFRITDSAGGVGSAPMYIVLPVRYKSFVTYVKLEEIAFHSGMIVDAGESLAAYRKSYLHITPRFVNLPKKKLSDSAIKSWIEN